jgi:hypothetical protein
LFEKYPSASGYTGIELGLEAQGLNATQASVVIAHAVGTTCPSMLPTLNGVYSVPVTAASDQSKHNDPWNTGTGSPGSGQTH